MAEDYEFQLPSGKIVVFSGSRNLEDPAERKYMRAWIARHYPDDAKALGIEEKPAADFMGQQLAQLGVSTGNAVSGIEGIADWITGDKTSNNLGGKSLADWSRNFYTPEVLNTIAKTPGALDALVKRGEVTPESLMTLLAGGQNAVMESGVETAGSVLLGGGAGLAAKGLGLGAKGIAGAGMAGAALSEAGLGGGHGYDSALEYMSAQRADAKSPIRQSPRFLELRQAAESSGLKGQAAEAKAWDTLTQEVASEAAGGAAIANIVPALIGGYFGGKMISPLIEKSILGPAARIGTRSLDEVAASGGLANAAKTVGAKTLGMAPVEGAEEFLQSGGEQYTSNVSLGKVDPRIKPMDNVAQSATLGGLSGIMGGAGFGAGAGVLDANANNQTAKAAQSIIGSGATNDAKLAEVTPGGINQQETAQVIDKKRAEFLPQAQREVAARAAQPAPASTPLRLGYDPTVVNEANVGPDPVADIGAAINRARGEVRSVIEERAKDPALPNRATVKIKNKKGKDVEVDASSTFDDIMKPVEALETARQNFQTQVAQLEAELAARQNKPEGVRKDFDPIIKDTKSKLIKAREAFKKAQAVAQRELSTRANKWNEIAKRNNMPTIDLGAKKQSTLGVSPDGKPFVAGTVTPAPAPKVAESTPTPVQEPNVPDTPTIVRARELISAVDKGGIPSSPIIVNGIARSLGLDVDPNSKTADTIERIRAALPKKSTAQVDVAPQKIAPSESRDMAKFFRDLEDNADLDTPMEETPGVVEETQEEAQRWAENAESYDELRAALKDTSRPMRAEAARAELDFNGQDYEASEPGPRDPDVSIEDKMKALRERLAPEPEQPVAPAEPFENQSLPPVGDNPSLPPVEGKRLTKSSQLPPPPKREIDLSKATSFDIVPVTNESKLGAFNERLQGGTDYTGTPVAGYKIVHNRESLGATEAGEFAIGKPFRQTFKTREEAEDFLAANAPEGARINVPERAKIKVREQKREAEEKKQAEKQARLDEANKLATQRAVEWVDNWQKQIVKIVEQELKRVGLNDKNVKVALIDEVQKVIPGYPTIAENVIATFITAKLNESPVGVLAVHRYLVNPNMKEAEVRAKIRDVFGHEVMHAFIRGGFIKPEEYSMLLRLVRKRKMPGERGNKGGGLTYLEYTQMNYSGLTREQQEEEAIAELVRLEGFGVSRGAMGSEARGVIDRIVRLVKGIFSLFQNKDFDKFVTFVEEVKNGKLAERVTGNIGFDPSNPLDPLGRSLKAAQADIRLKGFKKEPPKFSVPVRGDSNQDRLTKMHDKYVEEKGEFPANFGKSPTTGTISVDVELGGAIASGNPKDVISQLPSMKLENARFIENKNGDKGKVILVEFSTKQDVTTFADIADLSKIAQFDPELARDIGKLNVVMYEGLSEGAVGGFFKNGMDGDAKKIVLLNGKPSDIIAVNARASGNDSVAESIIKTLIHEGNHLANWLAGYGPHGVMAGRGTVQSFAPNLDPASAIQNDVYTRLSDAGNLISMAVNAEALRILQSDRGNNALDDGPKAKILNEIKEAASSVASDFFSPLFAVAGEGPSFVEERTRAGYTSDEVNNVIVDVFSARLNNVAMSAQGKVNDKLGRIAARLASKYPNEVRFISFAMQTEVDTHIAKLLANFDSNTDKAFAGKGENEKNLSKILLSDFAKKVADRFGMRHQYIMDEGEQTSGIAESSDRNDNSIIGSIKRPAKTVSLNKPQGQIRSAEGERSLPNTGLTEAARENTMKDIGLRMFSKGDTTQSDIRATGMDSLRALNMGDVDTLWQIMRDQPSIGAEDATKLLNQLKRSDRRPYRLGEVQGIINRLATIDPKLTRDGMNIEAMLKYEKAWGAGRLKGVIEDALAGKTDGQIARAHGLARSSVRSGLDEINVQQDTFTQSDMKLTPQIAAKRIPPDWIKGQTYRANSDDGMALAPETAFNDKGAWLYARGPDYVRQEAIRKSKDGGEGRSLGEIVQTLREAGYKGGDTPVIKAFMAYENFLRDRLDPASLWFTQSDMSIGNDGGDNVDDSFMSRRKKQIEDAQFEANRPLTYDERTAQIEEQSKKLNAAKMDFFGSASPSTEAITQKVMADYKKDRPFAWKRLNDLGEELVLNTGRQAVNIFLPGADKFIEGAARRATNYRDISERHEEKKVRDRTASLAEFFEWLGPRYGIETTQSDIKLNSGFVGRYKPSKVTDEQWRDARKSGRGYGLSEQEFDVFDVINNGPPEGLTTEEILEKINEYRDEDNLLDPEDIRQIVLKIKKKRYPINNAELQRQDRTKRVIELMDGGVGRSEIVRRLYQEEVEHDVTRGILTREKAIQKYANSVSSIYSQEKARRRATTQSDVSLSLSARAVKEWDAKRKGAIAENAAEYAKNAENDAILDQMTSLHRLFGKFVPEPEKFIFEQINTAEGLERLVHKYRKAGGKVDYASNPVIQDEKSKGRTTPEVESVTKEVIDPILAHIETLGVTDAMIEELSKDVDVAARWFAAQKENGIKDNSYRAAGLYLLAKHAPEREAFIKAKRRQGAELRDAEGNKGVGIQLDEAAQIVEFFNRKIGEDQMNKLSVLVKNSTNKITSIRKEGGLIPRDIENIFNFYVPARGFAERDGEDDVDFVTINVGNRGRTALKQDMSPRGRISLPDDPLISIAQMLQVAIMRKNTNATLNSIRRLVENNEGAFENDGKFVAAVHYTKPPGVKLDEKPNWLRGKVVKAEADATDITEAADADVFYIELSDEFANVSKYFMPRMFKEGNVEKLLSSTKMIAPVMDFLRDMRTARNPAFLPVNYVRDVGTGYFNIEMFVPGAQGKFLSRIPAITKDLIEFVRGGNTSKYAKLAQEFLDNGGSQKMHVIDDYDRLSKQITDKISKINHSDNSPVEKTKKTVVFLADVLEKANNAAELVSRISAYSLAKEAALAEGRSENEAISRAVYVGRNITVNFNKHGSIGKGMNNLYMFWNASIGGTSQILRAAMSSPKVQTQLLAVAALGFAMPFILKGLMGDEYEKIPEWVKDRNFILPIPGTGDYVKIPLPYGYSWFYTQGMTAAEIMDKANNPLYGTGGAIQWATIRTLDGLMNNFSPTGSSEDPLTLLAPTLADPILELAQNKDWTGRPIAPEPGMKDYDRESQRFWSNTSPMYTGTAGFLSSITGGQGRLDGMIEISPNQLEYLTEYVFGGLGKFVNQTVSTATGRADGVNDVPFVRSFAGTTTDETSVSSEYARLQGSVKRVERTIDDARQAGNYSRIAELERNFAFESSLIEEFKRAERAISRQQSARRGIEGKYRDGNATPNENDRQRLEEIKQKIAEAKRKAIDAVSARR